jgi:hypothetical protein
MKANSRTYPQLFQKWRFGSSCTFKSLTTLLLSNFQNKFYSTTFLLMTVFFSVSSLAVSGQAGKNYQHWADGDAAQGTAAEWNNNILSANKSDYFEGEVIPHVAILPASNNAPLVNNTVYTFTVILQLLPG